MKNYTVAIVFSSLYIAYVLLSMLTSTVMNRRQRARINPFGDATTKEHPNPGDTSRIEPRYRAPNVTADEQDTQPSMAAVDTSLFPRYRAQNVTPDDQDTEPTMRPIRPSIISNLRPTSLDNRWSSSSFDEVGEPGDWDLNEKIHGLSEFMKSKNIRGRSSLDLTKPFDKQVNSFLRP